MDKHHQLLLQTAVVSITEAQQLLSQAHLAVDQARQIMQEKVDEITQQDNLSVLQIKHSKQEIKKLLSQYMEVLQLIRHHTHHIQEGFYDAMDTLQIDALLESMQQVK